MSDILEERQKTHGSFSAAARISYGIKKLIHEYNGGLAIEQLEALDQIAMKIARIVTGEATFQDHWDDIIGYARLGKGERP